MAYSTDVGAAKALAAQLHAGQTDKAGLPEFSIRSSHLRSPLNLRYRS